MPSCANMIGGDGGADHALKVFGDGNQQHAAGPNTNVIAMNPVGTTSGGSHHENNNNNNNNNNKIGRAHV